jgi:hypothetical protein
MIRINLVPHTGSLFADLRDEQNAPAISKAFKEAIETVGPAIPGDTVEKFCRITGDRDPAAVWWNLTELLKKLGVRGRK